MHLMIKKNYVQEIGLLKQALNHGLIWRKVYAAKKSKLKRSLELYNSSSTYFRTIAENYFEKDTTKFFKSIQSERNKKDVYC